MAERKVIREPDEETGLAVFDREPVVLPEQRKKAKEMAEEKTERARERLSEVLD